MPKTIKLNQMDFKITEEELKTVKESQEKLNQAISQIGVLEAQKHGLLHALADINKDTESNKALLEEKYGAISINLEDGSYTNITEEEKE
jgi:hypothetical protein|tara:strand:+ start:464 stop:733 length:270 start_codon:yes stop_codon:yes gene_type:complete